MRSVLLLIGPRRRVLLGILIATLFAAWQLDLRVAEIVPSSAGWNIVREFFGAAPFPALEYEDAPPSGSLPLTLKVLYASWRTIAFAVAAVALALVFGVVLAFLSSSAWWEDDPAGHGQPVIHVIQKTIRPITVWLTRTIAVLLRSIHELLWAVLFLSAMGLNTLTAVLAIAIPYTGVFAKVFSEIIDETPRDAAYALRAMGASPGKVFLYGLIPRATPDMIGYACYRLECGMRSAAVMGFFGIQTLGYYLKPAFDEQHYHEVWTYLYAMISLILVVDWWSSRIRRRLVA